MKGDFENQLNKPKPRNTAEELLRLARNTDDVSQDFKFSDQNHSSPETTYKIEENNPYNRIMGEKDIGSAIMIQKHIRRFLHQKSYTALKKSILQSQLQMK